MDYIRQSDYDYIMNKYHQQNEPFDSLRRFVRNDTIFEKESGMEPEEILLGIISQDNEIQTLAHPVRKAKAFEYVLKHTRISCDKRDIFPAINMIDRPLNKTIVAAWNEEVFGQIIPDIEEMRSNFGREGIATIWPDYDHSVPVWDRVFALGFKGLLAESENVRAGKGNLTEEQDAFYEGIKITYSAILNFLNRLEMQAEKQGSEKLAKALANIKVNAPDSFYEALLVDYIYFILSEHIEGLQVRSLSNFDRLFYHFYQKDMERGINEEEIRTDLAYFLLQFTAIGNYWNQPIFFGGCKANGDTEINELSYIFLDVYDKMGIYNPKLQIKFADNMPKKFVLKALDMIRRGNNCIVFVNDATIRKALERVGATEEQARLCNVKGCYEYSVQGSMGIGMNYVNLLKPLEYALHQGCDGVTGRFAGLQSPEVTEYTTFELFYAEYKKQLEYVINKVIEIVNGFEEYLAYVNPQPMLSATYPRCIETGRDALEGGAVSNGSAIMFGFMADIADSLTIIKKYVYEQKKITLSELCDILDCNFEGHELFYREIRADKDKYGNNREMPDAFVKEIVDFVCSKVCGRKNAAGRGGKWNLGFHVARQSYDQAPRTAASPNGRKRGEELSKNMSASMGMNREGATAAILSVTKIDATQFASDASLDLGLLPSAVKGDDGLEAMYALLCTFMKRGGHAIHINVFDADTLRAAQREPEKYQDLQIRVCGWNVLFNNISREEQDGFIKQAESLV